MRSLISLTDRLSRWIAAGEGWRGALRGVLFLVIVTVVTMPIRLFADPLVLVTLFTNYPRAAYPVTGVLLLLVVFLVALNLVSLYKAIQLKGRSGFWFVLCTMGPLSPIGIIVIFALRDTNAKPLSAAASTEAATRAPAMGRLISIICGLVMFVTFLALVRSRSELDRIRGEETQLGVEYRSGDGYFVYEPGNYMPRKATSEETEKMWALERQLSAVNDRRGTLGLIMALSLAVLLGQAIWRQRERIAPVIKRAFTWVRDFFSETSYRWGAGGIVIASLGLTIHHSDWSKESDFAYFLGWIIILTGAAFLMKAIMQAAIRAVGLQKQ